MANEFDTELAAYEEFDQSLRLLADGYKIVVLQEYLYRWYLQSESGCHGRQGLRKHESKLRILEKWNPERVARARELLTVAEYTWLKHQALLEASRDYAYYAEYETARNYATQALTLGGGSLRDRMLLSCLATAPRGYRAWARTVDAGKSVARWLLRR
ncbi:MAG: hypothetical protein ACUVX8_16465 [Candidatus Zipacnadales bacterium]